MNTLIRFFLDHALLVKLCFMGVIALGLYKMITIQKEGFPAVDLNQITITTNYPGASAEDVELNVTTKLEDEIEEVDGLYESSSTSLENRSVIVIKADEDANPREFSEIVDDLDKAVDKVRDLPSDLEELPVIDVASTADTPIISINLAGPHDKLRELIPLLERQIEIQPGVSGADKIGYFDREMHIEIDPIKAKQLRIGISDVLRAIEARNLRTTGGTLESYLDEYTVVSLNKFKSPEEVGDVILRSSVTGQSVKVRDVASITLREKDETLIVRNDGEPGMSLVVRKKKKADIIKTLDGVKQFMTDNPLPEGISYSYSNDQSARTRLRLQVLGGNALMGFALVALVLMLALNIRTALWTAMSVPFSLFGTFILVPEFGITLNVVSLAGFVLVLGLLVDDAIVVAEKISFHRERGLSPMEAAQRGTQEMWLPVLVASITTILAFSPMFHLGGMPGKFAWAIPAVVILALLVSLFDSFFILPHHLASGKNAAARGKPEWIKRLEGMYKCLLTLLLKWRYLVLIFMLGVFALGIVVAKKHMRFQMFPQDGVETIYIKLEMPRGASLAATDERIEQIEQIVSSLPINELESYSSRIGTLSVQAKKNKGDHSHWGIVRVYLTGESARSRTADDLIDALRRDIPPMDGQKLLFDKERVGPPIGKPVEARIITNDDALRASTGAELMAFLKTQSGVFDIETDNKPGKDQLIVDIDYQRLAEVNLTVNDIADALRVTFDGSLVSSTTSVAETLDYRVIMAPEFRGNRDMIYNIPVRNSRDKVLTLKDVLTLREDTGPLEFHHVNGVRTETVTADVDVNQNTVRKVIAAAKENFGDQWANASDLRVQFAGEARETRKVFGGFMVAGLIALISIYLVVALLLNSLAQPAIVMSVIPFAVIGVIYTFFLHGQPLSFFSTMGTLGLIGVVVNDTIIMVTEANRELKENAGSSLVSTIAEGAKNRLRPVLLTTVTTAVGLLPTAYGIGGRDALIMPLTLAMAWGLIFATLITLVLTPTLIAIGEDLGRLLGRSPKRAG